MYLKCNQNTITLNSKYLLEHEHIKLNVVIEKRNNILIKGVVSNPKNGPMKNACIEIIRKSKNCRDEILGCVFSNNEGKYAIAIEIDPCSEYIFNVYSSL